MEVTQFIEKLRNIKGVIAVAQFGSYETSMWIKDRSDIDLAVIVAPSISFMDTLNNEILFVSF